MTKQQANINPMLFFGGLVVGAVLTALYTPKNGPEMRQKLKQNADKVSENLKSNTNDIKQKAQTTKEKAAAKLQKPEKQKEAPPLPPTTT